MVLQNYQAEQTLLSHWGMGSWIVLELVTIHNLFTKIAWNRLFFNEELYITPTDWAKDFAEKWDVKKPDLRDPEQREDFIQFIRKQNKLFPGMFAPDGEDVDVEKLIDKWCLKNPAGGSKDYTDQEIKDLFYFLRGND